MPKRPLSPAEGRRIASSLHVAFLSGLLDSSVWQCSDLAFQGGTSLHLVWKSPRFSEDLDFLLNGEKKAALQRAVRQIQRKVNEQAELLWPGSSVQVKTKEKPDGKLLTYHFTWTHPDVLGKVLTHMEFWQVDAEQMAAYQSVLKNFGSGQAESFYATLASQALIPAARPEAIYTDKLHALATRGHLKWRDIFDIWYLRTHCHVPGVAEQPDFLPLAQVVASMYSDKFAQTWIPALNDFVAQPVDDLVAAAEKGLQPWLPPAMWQMMWPAQVKEMVELVQAEVAAAVQVLAQGLPPLEVQP